MNDWLAAALAMIVCLIPPGIACFRGRPEERLVGFELAGTLTALAMVLIAEGLGRPSFLDLPLTVALLSFAGGLVFARFLERRL